MPVSYQSNASRSGGRDPGDTILPWVGLGRALGGAIIFSLPMMMTMEMWWLGFYISHYRLLALLALSIPLFLGVARIVGFRGVKTMVDDVVDVFVAYTVGLFASATVLITFGVIDISTPPDDLISKVFLQAVPATLGALLGRSVVGSGETRANEDPEQQDYKDELVILTTGAVFLAFNMAPTEEIVKLAYEMTAWHAVALLVLTIIVMHCFSNASTERSNAELKTARIQWSLFLRFTCLGYVVAFLVSLFMLWVFGRTSNEAFDAVFMAAVVLGFPAGIGASASRLIL